jgi:outer membrane protein assembly factor BamB
MPARRSALACLAITGVLLPGCTSGGSKSPTVSSSPAIPTSIATSTPTTASQTPTAAKPPDPDWPTYHGDLKRTGVSTTMPAASGHLTAAKIALDGQVYASPIILTDGSDKLVVVATEKNRVYGLSTSGATKWSVDLGAPTPRSALPCGNIDPLGITGTPIYDAASHTVFAVASIGTTVRHDLVALDPHTGAIRWRRSVDLPGTDSQAMQERGALTIIGGRVWVPFGGLAGDCGAYKGRLVGVPLGNGKPIEYTIPTTREAGIWTPPGPTVFGDRLYVAAGNGESVGGRYDYSDSVLELSGNRLVDSFSPDTWASDNRTDLDLGSQGPAIVNGKWIFIAGKSGTGYVLQIGKLGGIGGEVSQQQLCASFGGTAIVGNIVYVPCRDGVRAVQVSPAGTMKTLWHVADSIAGSPVVGGGRVYALDQPGGVLHALDPATGRTREQIKVGETTRFATPAISGGSLFVPTLTGITIVRTSR